MRPRTRRTRGDVGAAAVEFALLFPIFMILALGIIYGGLAFSKQITITQAAREASRFGATYDVAVAATASGAAAGDLNPWLDAVRDSAKEATGNSVDPLGGYDYICVAYVVTMTGSTGTVEVDALKSKHLITARSTADPSVFADTRDTGACPSVDAALIKDTTYVQVTLAREALFFIPGVPGSPGNIDTTLNIDSVSVTPYELRPSP